MNEPQDKGVVVPWEQLEAVTLRRVAESFVTREGTDYGEREVTLSQKTDEVLAQLRRGEAQILFSIEEETLDIVPVRR